jgi:hypothetical protein
VIVRIAILVWLFLLGLMVAQAAYQGYYASYYYDSEAPPEGY